MSFDNSHIEQLLTSAMNTTTGHQMLLNTFAYMEHLGAQKLQRLQRHGYTSEDILQHTAEEARHAWFFKSRIKLLGTSLHKDFSPATLLNKRAAGHYFRALEILIGRFLQQSELASTKREAWYLLTTWLVEERATLIYNRYERLLRQVDSPIRLRSILAEEKRHLCEIRKKLDKQLPGLNEQQLRNEEEKIFGQWLQINYCAARNAK